MSSFIANKQFKKEFIAQAKENSKGVWVESFSIVDEFAGSLYQAMLTRADITVTNSKRAWFARVERKPDGTLKVS